MIAAGRRHGGEGGPDMGDVRLEWDPKALTGPADRWFPWLGGQPNHIKTELQLLVSTAEHVRAEWTVAREKLAKELRALADDTSAPRGEVEALTDDIRGVLAGPDDPEQVAGFADAGRVGLGKQVRVYVTERVRPGDIRAKDAIRDVRAGTGRLSASLAQMHGLAKRIEKAREGWTAQVPAAEGRPETVDRVMRDDHPRGARSEGGRRTESGIAPRSGWRGRGKGRGPRGGSRSG
jgi:hypothetical protein